MPSIDYMYITVRSKVLTMNYTMIRYIIYHDYSHRSTGNVRSRSKSY